MASLSSNGRALHKPHSSLNSSTNDNLISSRNSTTGTQVQPHSVRSKSASSNPRRSITPTSRTQALPIDHDPESERVRVAVRLRPRNSEDLCDVDYADCVETQLEMKRLKLRKNNWSSEYYRFDEVFAESASQKRIYEVVAKPVVESVLEGYNGTIMAYGQTGTGKTYTLGRLGKDDAAERGIMVRALEDIIADTSTSDSIEISYLQLYMESVQDLLAPEKTNVPIVEDAKSGDVSVPGAEIVKIRNLDHFLQLLHTGESNRHATNTKMNTESSRSHAILMVFIRKSVNGKEEIETSQQKVGPTGRHVSTIRKSKLLIVDLAGSERLDKSGSEGHMLEEAKFINLSLTSLGKCINALAENSPHIPVRDSKLTRLLRDSFGGSARTSLIITIGPSYRHHAETASTVMFGQRAMKVVNTVKIKEEFDYESLCRKLEAQNDHLTIEIDIQQKLRLNERGEMDNKLEEFEKYSAEAEKRFVARSELLCKENDQLTSNMKALLRDFDVLKHQNELLLDDISHLETSAKKNETLEEKNTRLEMKLNDTVKDLNRQKDENGILHNEVRRLEMNGQQQLDSLSYQKILADVSQEFERKLEEERAERAKQQALIEEIMRKMGSG